MATFTSTLPNPLWEELTRKSAELGMPKNKLLEAALRLYLEHLNKAAYLRSYKGMAADADIRMLAEEGMEDYLKQVREADEAR